MADLGRREFVIAGFLTAGVAIYSANKLFTRVSPHETLSLLQYDLFPKAKELGVDLPKYLTIILHHSRITGDEKEYIRNGIGWINETSQERYNKLYTELSEQQRQELLSHISTLEWGESYMQTILSYILEAIFSDPVYGVNPARGGQKWVAFENGLPYPKEAYL